MLFQDGLFSGLLASAEVLRKEVHQRPLPNLLRGQPTNGSTLLGELSEFPYDQRESPPGTVDQEPRAEEGT